MADMYEILKKVRSIHLCSDDYAVFAVAVSFVELMPPFLTKNRLVLYSPRCRGETPAIMSSKTLTQQGYMKSMEGVMSV